MRLVLIIALNWNELTKSKKLAALVLSASFDRHFSFWPLLPLLLWFRCLVIHSYIYFIYFICIDKKLPTAKRAKNLSWIFLAHVCLPRTMSVYKAYIYAHGFVIFTHFCLLLDSRCQAFSACFRKSISRLGRCGRCAIATATSVGPPISESQPSNYDWVFSVSVCFPCYLFSHPFHPFNSLGENNFPSKW